MHSAEARLDDDPSDAALKSLAKARAVAADTAELLRRAERLLGASQAAAAERERARQETRLAELDRQLARSARPRAR